MNNSDFENTAKAWQYIEKEALSTESASYQKTRRRGADAGLPQASAAQAQFLSFQVRCLRAQSIIFIGTGNLVEVDRLIEALHGEGILTVVDSTAKGADIIRNSISKSENPVTTKVRVVNTEVSDYLSKLNPEDYDLMIIAGEAGNYSPALESAQRLLKTGGVLVLLDALALYRNPNGGLTNPADRSDKAVALRTVLDTLHQDTAFESSLIPVGTGLALALKR